jgi:hypothetical protein
MSRPKKADVMNQLDVIGLAGMRLGVMLARRYPGRMTPGRLDEEIFRALLRQAFDACRHCIHLADGSAFCDALLEDLIAETGTLYGLKD